VVIIIIIHMPPSITALDTYCNLTAQRHKGQHATSLIFWIIMLTLYGVFWYNFIFVLQILDYGFDRLGATSEVNLHCVLASVQNIFSFCVDIDLLLSSLLFFIFLYIAFEIWHIRKLPIQLALVEPQRIMACLSVYVWWNKLWAVCYLMIEFFH